MAKANNRARALKPPPELPTEIILRIFKFRIQANNESASALSHADTIRLATVSHATLALAINTLKRDLKMWTAHEEQTFERWKAVMFSRRGGVYSDEAVSGILFERTAFATI